LPSRRSGVAVCRRPRRQASGSRAGGRGLCAWGVFLRWAHRSSPTPGFAIGAGSLGPRQVKTRQGKTRQDKTESARLACFVTVTPSTSKCTAGTVRSTSYWVWVLCTGYSQYCTTWGCLRVHRVEPQDLGTFILTPCNYSTDSKCSSTLRRHNGCSAQGSSESPGYSRGSFVCTVRLVLGKFQGSRKRREVRNPTIPRPSERK
jgi:hypothetical protein